MTVGLLRHFPVTEPMPSGWWWSSADLQAWQQRYNHAPAQPGPFDLGGLAWQRCLSSDLERARVTAATVYRGQVEFTPLLREAELAPFPTGRLRMPVLAWRFLLQLAWMLGHSSQRACRDDFHQRVRTLADMLCAERGDVLLVSHAGMLAYLSAELRRRGFSGPRLRLARHATAYLYRR